MEGRDADRKQRIHSIMEVFDEAQDGGHDRLLCQYYRKSNQASQKPESMASDLWYPANGKGMAAFALSAPCRGAAINLENSLLQETFSFGLLLYLA